MDLILIIKLNIHINDMIYYIHKSSHIILENTILLSTINCIGVLLILYLSNSISLSYKETVPSNIYIIINIPLRPTTK